MKIRLTEFAKRQKITFEEAQELVKTKLSQEMTTGKGKNTWVDEEGNKILMDCMFVHEIIPKHYKGHVRNPKDALNPGYVFAYIGEISKKVPVVVPRKHKKDMKGKTITIEMIEDANGKSYRYVK